MDSLARVIPVQGWWSTYLAIDEADNAVETLGFRQARESSVFSVLCKKQVTRSQLRSEFWCFVYTTYLFDAFGSCEAYKVKFGLNMSHDRQKHMLTWTNFSGHASGGRLMH